ncbi:MAG TPA: MBL fold metallo-hydrolase [Steroidobacteraceae bacterium]|nr:MBL fold metallo-hydrolase [Steroidobacteraceae bacterium]
MAANVLLVEDVAYLIDCGYGAAGALARQGISLRDIEGIFITHNHADHLMDYGAVLLFAWLQGHTAPVRVYGPPPLEKITAWQLAANQVPLDYYKNDMGMAGMPQVIVRECSGRRVVMHDAHVRVSCTEVHHPPVKPALAYRFDLEDRSIVFSGDTSASQDLVTLAKGADVLVHEAADVDMTLKMMSDPTARGMINGSGGGAPAGFDARKFSEHVYNGHTSAEDAGRIAAAAEVKTLVLNHLSPGSSRVVTDSQWISMARRHFSGNIVVGHDGLTL